mgnify:FL=1
MDDKDNKGPLESLEELRKQAERRLQFQSVPLHRMSEADVGALVHELRVHEEELQMQNQSLREAQTNLEQSRAKYADLFDFAPIGYLVLDRDGIIREANLTAAKILGVERRRLMDKQLTWFLAHASRDAWRRHYMAVFDRAEPQESELEARHDPERPARTVRVRSHPLEGGNGKVVQCRTAMMDITAQVRAERRYSTIVENSKEGFAIVDAEGRFVEANEAYCRTLGYTRNDILHMTVANIQEPERRKQMTEHLARAQAGKFQRFQTRHIRSDGVHIDCDASIQKIDDDRFFIFSRDITEQKNAERQLAFQAQILADVSDAVVLIDNDRRVRYWNEAAEKLYDVAEEEALGRPLQEVYDFHWLRPEDEANARESIEREGAWHGTNVHVKKDGEELIVECSVSAWEDDEGHRRGLLGVIRDVTQEHRVEQQRAETLRRLELVLEATNDGIWDWDMVADRLWHNEPYATTYGYAPNEPQGSVEWWRERIHPEDREEVLGILENVLQDGTDHWSVRYRFGRKDGTYAWVMARAYVLRNERGEAIRMVGSILDMTEKLELVDELEGERSKLATILETALAGIVVVDEQARIIYANPAAHTLYNQRVPYRQEMNSHRQLGFLHPDGTPYEPRELPLVRSALEGETFIEEELLIEWPGGERRHLLANTSPLRDAQGRITGAVAIVQDISDLKRALEALQEAHDRLEERVRERTLELDNTVATLQEEVAEKTEAQGQLARQNEMLQTIINNIPVMLTFYDAQGRIGMINEAFRRTLGYTVEDLVEGDPMELFYPDPEYRRQVWQYMESAERGWRDFEVCTKSGETVVSSWANVCLSDGSYLGIGIDVRERKGFEDRLRESEQRYRTLVELSPDAIGVERDDVIQFVNSTALRLLGAEEPEDVLGHALLDFIHPDSRERTRKQIDFLHRRREPLPMAEQRVQRLDGTAVDVELAAMPITFEKEPAVQIVMRDVTARKLAEKRLRESAYQLQQQAELLELAHDAIVVNDMDGHIVYWNRGAEQTFGWTREQATGQISHDLLRTRFPLPLVDITARLLSQGRWNGEQTHTARNGETLIVSTRWALQRDDEGRPTGILMIDRDVTGQKRAELATVEAKRFAESITNTVQESLLVLDPEMRVISANQTFYRMFQLAPEQAEDRHLYDVDHGQWDIPELRELLETILPENATFENFEVQRDFHRIGHRTMLLNARRIYRQQQETQMILLAIQDITVRKEQEEKIRQHQRQLSTLTEELLLAEERERRRLAVTLHESIGQYLSFSKRELGVLQKKTTNDTREAIEYVRQQIEQAVQQTRDLTFELSPTTLHTFGLEAAVEELVEQYSERVGFEYRFQPSGEDLPLTEHMKALLFRASREVLQNISKHASASHVSIGIDQLNGSIRMIFVDDGRGFDVSRLETIIRDQEGLGLFSIRERLNHMGGTFSIESQPGEGTKVTLIAPLESNNGIEARREQP